MLITFSVGFRGGRAEGREKKIIENNRKEEKIFITSGIANEVIHVGLVLIVIDIIHHHVHC
jgi:hypothetical protein